MAGEAMTPLSGMPNKVFIHDEVRKPDKLWDQIYDANKRNFPMATAVASQVDVDLSATAVARKGLVDAHAYSLIDAQIITLDNGKKERLI